MTWQPVAITIALVTIVGIGLVNFAPQCDDKTPSLRLGHMLLAGCAK